MSRTKGSRDLRKRRRRKDRFRKMRKYEGHLIPYHPKRQKKDPIKVWFWERLPMSMTGRLKWNKYQRPRIFPKITHFHIRVDVDPERLRNKEAIEQLALEVLGYEGEFLLMLFSHGKNRYEVKPVKGCRVVITNTRNGLIGRVSETGRLARYWFWKGD